MTETEKLRRRLERKAAAHNAKLAAEHPLFVDQLKAEGAFTDARREYWRWRGVNTDGTKTVEWKYDILPVNPATKGLMWVELQAIERVAADLLGEHFAGMLAYVRKTYPMPDYGKSVWHDILTGEPKGFAFELRYDPARITRYNADGRYLAEIGKTVGHYMTAAEFDKRFSYEPAPPALIDDGGAADRLAAIFDREKAT